MIPCGNKQKESIAVAAILGTMFILFNDSNFKFQKFAVKIDQLEDYMKLLLVVVDKTQYAPFDKRKQAYSVHVICKYSPVSSREIDDFSTTPVTATTIYCLCLVQMMLWFAGSAYSVQEPSYRPRFFTPRECKAR